LDCSLFPVSPPLRLHRHVFSYPSHSHPIVEFAVQHMCSSYF
jgi:hypothetical protein